MLSKLQRCTHSPRDEIEEGPLIERVEFLEIHRGAAMVNRKSAI